MLKLAGIAAGLLAVIVAVSLIGCENNIGNDMVDINETAPGGDYHMIFWRIEQDDHAAVEAFLDAGVDVNIRGFMDMTPAIWAATSDSWEAVELLSSRGADLGIAARDGTTVAEVAKRTERLKRVKLDSPNGRAFLLVIQILKDRGLY